MDIALVLSRVTAITAELVVADIRSVATDTIEPMAATVSIIAEATADTVAKLGIETIAVTEAVDIEAVDIEAVAGIEVAVIIEAVAGIKVAINIEAAVGQVVTANLVAAITLLPSILVSRQSHHILGRPSQRQLQQLTTQLVGSLVLRAYRLQSMHPWSFQLFCQGKFRLLLDKALHTVSFL